jgi:hypothetical protein
LSVGLNASLLHSVQVQLDKLVCSVKSMGSPVFEANEAYGFKVWGCSIWVMRQQTQLLVINLHEVINI